MIRKVLMVAAAVAMPIGVVAASAGTAGAKVVKVDATNYTVSCTSITATAKFNPPLTTAGGAASNEATSISGSGSGCTVTPSSGGTPVTVSGVKIKGVINDATSTHTCGGLITPTTESGSLTAKWTASPKLVSSSSVINPTTVQGGAGADGNATFALAFGPATSGPFQGTDAGTSSSTSAETTTSISDILTLCGGKGIKKLGITTNTNSGAPVAIHVG
jgi:hypothetical protein